MIPYDLLADIALTRIQNPTAKTVLLSLAKYANAKGQCFPSRETISKDSCVSLRSVVRSIQWLESEGYIRTERRSNASNFYTLTSMEEDMTDDRGAKLAHEVVNTNITILDTNKSNTSYRAKLAHPLDTPLFSAFWQAYPRRIGKGLARVAFVKACKVADANTIIQAAIAYAAFVEETGVERQYIPHPSTWLNGERWEDDLESEKQVKSNTNGWGSALDEL